MMLHIADLHARIGEHEILRGVNLDVGRRRGARHHGPQRVG